MEMKEKKMAKSWKKNHLLVVLSLICFCLLLSTPLRAAEKTAGAKVIFLPFHIQLSGNYAYLRDGLTSIFASRVSSHAAIQVIHRTATSGKIAEYLAAGREQEAFRALEKSGVDFLVLGSLIRESGDLVLTVNVMDSQKGTVLHQYDRRFDTVEKAIPVLDDLAWDVSEGVFGVARPQQVVTPQYKKDGMSGFQTMHPDRAYKEGMFAGIMPGFDTGELSLLETRKSQKIPLGINDMAAGDLDGDGNVEFVLAAVNQLMIYRFAEEHFSKIETIPLDGYLRVHSISLADLDGNGFQEIYISANKGKEPASTVVEWDGKRSRLLEKDIPYYLQIAAPEGRQVLLGQSGGDLGTEAMISAQVYVLKRGEQGRFVRGPKKELPTGLTIFDIAYADLDGNGEVELIALTKNNTLKVFDATGQLLWTDAGQYGASSNYLGTMATAARSDKRIFIPTGLVIEDVNKDSKPDIIVCKNKMKVVKYFKRYRYFEGSSIAALSWNDGKLIPLWETKKIPDYTVSCQVMLHEGGAEGQGTDGFRLFFAQGQNNYSFGFWQSRSSSLIMYEIGTAKQ